MELWIREIAKVYFHQPFMHCECSIFANNQKEHMKEFIENIYQTFFRMLECDIKLVELKTVARLSGNVCVSGCAAQHKYLHRDWVNIWSGYPDRERWWMRMSEEQIKPVWLSASAASCICKQAANQPSSFHLWDRRPCAFYCRRRHRRSNRGQ